MNITTVHSLPVTPDLVAFEMDMNLTPDNVLIAPIGKLTKVALVGLLQDGEPYYASNVDPDETLQALEAFVYMLKQQKLGKK